MEQEVRKTITCQSCHNHPATRDYHDGIDIWRLCGYCLKAFRNIDKKFDDTVSKIDPDIAPDAWAEKEDEE